MKKIPRKNYITMAVMSILTFLIVGYFAFWYTETREYSDDYSVMTGYLLEIGEASLIDNLSNYLLDNPNTILYITYDNNAFVENFEQEFKQFINTHNIKQSFIYVDLNKVEDKKFISEFKDNFFAQELKNKNVEIVKQPNLFVFKEGRIESILYYVKQSINMADVKVFLENEGIIEND